jgi:hypothetical protein
MKLTLHTSNQTWFDAGLTRPNLVEPSNQTYNQPIQSCNHYYGGAICTLKKLAGLANSDLTYIRNPKRSKIILPFNLLKTYIRNPSTFFIFFHPTTYRETPMATTIREVSFGKFLFLPSWLAKLLEANFSCFAKIK